MKIEELKNEIWIEIAKTNDAAILQIIKELTTDKDFDHLKDVYLDLAFIDLDKIPK